VLEVTGAEVFDIDIDGSSVYEPVSEKYPGEEKAGNSFEMMPAPAPGKGGRAGIAVNFNLYYSKADDDFWLLPRNNQEYDRWFYEALLYAFSSEAYDEKMNSSRGIPAYDLKPLFNVLKVGSHDKQKGVLMNCTVLGVLDGKDFFLDKDLDLSFSKLRIYDGIKYRLLRYKDKKTDTSGTEDYARGITLNYDRLTLPDFRWFDKLNGILAEYGAELQFAREERLSDPGLLVFSLLTKEYFMENPEKWADLVLEMGAYKSVVYALSNADTRAFVAQRNIAFPQYFDFKVEKKLNDPAVLWALAKLEPIKNRPPEAELALETFREYLKHFSFSYKGSLGKKENELWYNLALLSLNFENPAAASRIYPEFDSWKRRDPVGRAVMAIPDEYLRVWADTPYFKRGAAGKAFLLAEYNRLFPNFKPLHPQKGAYVLVFNLIEPPEKVDPNYQYFLPAQSGDGPLYRPLNPNDAEMVIYATFSYTYLGKYRVRGAEKLSDVYTRSVSLEAKDLGTGKVIHTASITPDAREEYTISDHETHLDTHVMPQNKT
jgi:hypothetical protein